MAERKVQSKYMPADYDHRVLKALHDQEPKKKKKKTDKTKKQTVRVMLPFNVCCDNCKSYMARGRKFNGKKEEGKDPDYLGTKVLRFHIKCETCSAPMVFRTDPKSSGFVMVSGGRENKTTAGTFNPLADVVEIDVDKVANLDPVAALEQRALETKKEMDILHELEKEMQKSQARNLAAGKPLDLSKSDDVEQINDEEESAVRAFREKQRLLEFQTDSVFAPVKVSLDGLNKSKTDESFSFVRKVKKSKTTSSLVPYDDDDEDD